MFEEEKCNALVSLAD